MNNILQRIITIGLVILTIFYAERAFAQVFAISEVDTTSFPWVKASFKATDHLNNFYEDLVPADFNVIEDGRSKNATLNVDCQADTVDPAVSVVLIVDISTSMDEVPPDDPNNERYFDWVIEGIETFLNKLNFANGSQASLVCFNGDSQIRCGWTIDKEELLDSLELTQVYGKTIYDMPIVHPWASAPVLLRQRPTDVRRIMIFLTDGVPTVEPGDTLAEKVQDVNAQFYAITLRTSMHHSLEEISRETAGAAYEVYTKEDLAEIYELIALEVQTTQQCILSWLSHYGCDESSRKRDLSITFNRPANNITKNRQYLAPPSSVAEVDYQSFVSFGDPAINNSTTRQITIKPEVGPLVLTGSSISPPDFFDVIDWGGYSQGDTIHVGEEIVITVRFTQKNTKDYRKATLLFEGSPCPPIVTMVGGVSQVMVVEPNGGEVFSTCETVQINWTGVEANKPVDIYYKSEHKPNWTLIKSNATGLSYNWKPPEQGVQYSIRIVVSPESSYLCAASGGGPEDDIGTSLAVTNDDLYVYVAGSFKDVADFEDETLASYRNEDILVLKYDTDCNLICATKAGGPGADVANGVCVGPDGYAYVTGVCYDGAQFGALRPSMDSPTNPYLFVAKYPPNCGSPTIDIIGSKGVYTTFEAKGLRIRYDNGEIHILGKYKRQLQDRGFQLPDKGDRENWFIAIYDAASLDLKSLTPTYQEYDDWSDICDYDGDGNRYCTGSFEGTSNDYGAPLVSKGKKDVFLSKYGGKPGSEDESDAVFSVLEPILEFRSANVDLGACMLGANVTQTKYDELCNANGLPITIARTRIEPADREFLLSRDIVGQEIAPGECLDLEIEFNPADIGDRNATLFVEGECAREISLPLKGTGFCSGEAKTPIDMGSVNVNMKAELVVDSIFWNTNGQLVRIRPTIIGDNAADFQIKYPDDSDVTEIPVDAPPNDFVDLKVIFIPSAPGPRIAQIKWNLPQGCDDVRSDLTGIGINAEITVSAVDWDERRLGTVSDSFLVVSNNSELKATVEEIKFENPSDGVITINADYPIDIPANDTIRVPVSFAPTAEEVYSNNVLVKIQALDESLIAALRGVGVIPKIETEWICDQGTKIGETSNATLEIINPSESMDLYIEDIALDSPSGEFAFAVGAILQDIVIPKNGGSEILTVEFTPTAGGLRYAQVDIEHDAAWGPELEPRKTKTLAISCEGLGVSAEAELDFGAMLLCESEDMILTIGNNGGSSPLEITEFYFENDADGDSSAFNVQLPDGFVVDPNDSKSIIITFTPEAYKEYSTTLRLVNSFDADLSVDLSGFGEKFHLYTTENEIKEVPGKEFKVPISLKLPELSQKVDEIVVRIRYNHMMCEHVSNYIDGHLSNWNWDKPVYPEPGLIEYRGEAGSGKVIDPPFDQKIFSIKFQLYLDSVSATPIVFLPVHGVCQVQDTLGATVTLKDICYLKGRLVVVGKPYLLKEPVPNPAADAFNLSFQVGLKGQTTVEIYNAMGALVATLVDEKLLEGEYNINASAAGLPSGAYHLIMRSGSFVDTKRLIISK